MKREHFVNYIDTPLEIGESKKETNNAERILLKWKAEAFHSPESEQWASALCEQYSNNALKANKTV